MLVPILSFLGVLAGVLGGWLAQRRLTSGKIVTTEAKTLWDESTSIRKELREEVTRLNTQVQECHQREEAQREEMRAMKAEIRDLRRQVGSP